MLSFLFGISITLNIIFIVIIKIISTLKKEGIYEKVYNLFSNDNDVPSGWDI